MKFTFRDFVVFGVIFLLAVLPDPLDLIDFGTPLFEGVLAVVYYIIRSKGEKKS